MSLTNPVIWSEGLFIKPQHFQQHTRYLETYIERRTAALGCYAWGFSALELDREQLALGKLAIQRAAGVLPDGTPFRVPEDHPTPPPLVVPAGLREGTVWLGLPARREGQADVINETETDATNLARYRRASVEAPDTADGEARLTPLQTGELRLRLLNAQQERAQFVTLPLARIEDVRADGSVVLDETFMPTGLDCAAVGPLTRFLNELSGLLSQRAQALSERLASSAQGVAEVSDFMLLQAVNRALPLVQHLARIEPLHPERLYGELARLAGELASFTTGVRIAPEFPAYRHDDLTASFAPLMDNLRRALSMVFEQNAIALELEERDYGIRVSPITDASLIDTAQFVLAVNADVPDEQLRGQLPTQIKIGPVEMIRQLVNLQLPGIRLKPLPVAPRQLPYHAGYSYFELDRSGELWTSMRDSGGFAFHLAGNFPDIALQFWAIRDTRR